MAGGGGVGMSEALAPRPWLPRRLLPELLSAKLPAPTALKSPLQFLPPSLGCAGYRKGGWRLTPSLFQGLPPQVFM